MILKPTIMQRCEPLSVRQRTERVHLGEPIAGCTERSMESGGLSYMPLQCEEARETREMVKTRAERMSVTMKHDENQQSEHA